MGVTQATPLGKAMRKKMANGVSILPFFMVFGGCMSTMVFLEYVLKFSKDSMAMVTFTELVFVLAQSLPSLFDKGKLRPLRCSAKNHAMHAGLWVTMLWFVNYAYGFKIDVPTHTIFRACNIVSSVVIGYLAFNVSYTARQILCVAAVTVGVIFATIGDLSVLCRGIDQSQCSLSNMIANLAGEGEGDSGLWIVGIIILILVLILQGLLGHLQRKFHDETGKDAQDQVSNEFLIISHFVGLIPSLFTWNSITTQWNLMFESPPVDPVYFPVPFIVCMLVSNNITHSMCIKGVFMLAGRHSPLTVNIVLSVRKFLTVCVSIWWFNNPWTLSHTIAMILVFGGAFFYSCSPPPEPVKVKEKKTN